MTFLGQAAITAPIRTTARALLAVAGLLAMVWLGWVEVDGLTVFEATLVEGRAEAVLCVLAGFLIAAHVVQWFGDFLSYRAWNVVGAEPDNQTVIGERRHRKFLPASFNRAERLAERLAADKVTEFTLKEDIEKCKSDLRKLTGPITEFKIYAFCYVWVWHGALPVLLALAAIFWPLHG